MSRLFSLTLLAVCTLALASCGKKQQPPDKALTSETTPVDAAATKPLDGEVNPFLTQQLRSFIEKQGRLPTDFAELVRTSLDSRPRTPAGMRWAIDPITKEVKLVKQ